MKNIEQKETLRVALYIRVSTDEQVERYGIPLQEEALKALIKSKPKLEGGKDSMVLAGDKYIYIDKGVSGTDQLDERPAFAKLKEDIIFAPEGNKPFDIVAVYKIDRFARKLKILLELIDFFEDHGVQFISVNENIDTSTAFGRAILSIIGVIAELERENILERTQGGRERAFEAGVAMGASAPYGYKKDTEKKYTIFDTEAETVKAIFAMFVNEKKTPEQISKYLKTNEILSPQASAIINKKRKGEMTKKNHINFWRPERVRYILHDEIYIGNIYSNKKKNGKSMPKLEWKKSSTLAPSIIDRIMFTKAQDILLQNKHQKKEARDGHIYLLSGLLKCDCCYKPDIDNRGRITWSGERKEIKKNSNHFTYLYKCGRKNILENTIICNSLPLPASAVETYVFNLIKKLLENPQAVINYQKKLKSNKTAIKHLYNKENDIVNLINALPERKNKIKEQHEFGYIDSNQLKKRIKELDIKEELYKKQREEIALQIAQDTISEGYNEAIKVLAENYNILLKRGLENNKELLYKILHEIIEEIIVYSRPVEKTDIIAGRKKEKQQIPFRIHIKLKLPQDIISQFKEIGSGDKIVSGGRYRNRTYYLVYVKDTL